MPGDKDSTRQNDPEHDLKKEGRRCSVALGLRRVFRKKRVNGLGEDAVYLPDGSEKERLRTLQEAERGEAELQRQDGCLERAAQGLEQSGPALLESEEQGSLVAPPIEKLEPARTRAEAVHEKKIDSGGNRGNDVRARHDGKRAEAGDAQAQHGQNAKGFADAVEDAETGEIQRPLEHGAAQSARALDENPERSQVQEGRDRAVTRHEPKAAGNSVGHDEKSGLKPKASAPMHGPVGLFTFGQL